MSQEVSFYAAFYPPTPYSILQVSWAVLSGSVAHAITRRRLPSALLTGAFVSVLPALEDRILRSDLYEKVLRVYYGGGPDERKEYERRRQRLLDEYGFDLEPWPLPPLRTLLRVVPVAQEQPLEGGVLLITTLESYAEGCIVFVRLLIDDVHGASDSEDEESGFSVPEPALSVRDDRGRRYRVGSVFSSGGGEDWGYYWEFRVSL